MSIILIRDLNPAGHELLLDNESYLSSLEADELSLVQGGSGVFCTAMTGTFCAAAGMSMATPRAHQFSYRVSHWVGRRF